jgi:hypothetical protein
LCILIGKIIDIQEQEIYYKLMKNQYVLEIVFLTFRASTVLATVAKPEFLDIAN